MTDDPTPAAAVAVPLDAPVGRPVPERADSPLSERNVRMAARLYEIRDTARRLLGDDYAGKIGSLGTALQGVAKGTKRELLDVAIEAAKDAPGLKQCYILAAYVELVEPSEPPNLQLTGPAGPKE